MSYKMKRANTVDDWFFMVAINTALSIHNATPEQQAGTLCDKAEFTASDITFLKELKLKDLTFEGVEQTAIFNIKNTSTNEKMQFSNRASTQNEMRGENFRSRLLKLQQTDPEKSLYDCISEIMNSKDYDTYIKYKNDIGTLIGNDVEMAESYLQEILNLLKQGSTIKEIESGDFNTPKFDEYKQIFNQLALNKFKEEFYNKIELLPAEISDLKKRNTEACVAAGLLDASLRKAAAKFFDTPDSTTPFGTRLSAFELDCTDAITMAKSALATDRRMMKFLADLTFLLISTLTLGVANYVSSKMTGSYRFFDVKNSSEKVVAKITDTLNELPTDDTEAPSQNH